jgi:hypothetical protein
MATKIQGPARDDKAAQSRPLYQGKRYDVVPVRGVMSARSLPGCPVLLMDVKTRHWIG